MTDSAEMASSDSTIEGTLSRSESIRSAVQTFSPLHELVFVFVVCMSQFMTQAALGNTLAPLEIISDSFGITNPGISSWLIAGYSLTVGTFILFFGRCGDIFGYRILYIIGWIWFAIWSRPGKKKYMVFSLFGATAPNGAVLGAIFASLFSQLAWWPWTFWAMAIYCFVLAIMSFLAIPPSPSIAQGMSLGQLVSELDVVGAFFGVAGLVLINIAWNQAPVVGWQEAYVYVLLIIGALILATFFVWEIKYASKPLIPFHALDLDVCFILGCIACGWASFGIWVYYFWRFLENIRGISPLLASAQFIPPALSGLTASFTTGLLMARLRPGWIMLMAMVAFTLGNIFSAIAPVHQTYWALAFVTLLVTPWGMDMSFPAATVVLSNAVGRRHQGVAASLVTTVVNYSISLGLGFAGTVEVHVNNGGQTFHDTLIGYRGALYMGIGLGGLGVAISLLYLIKSRPRPGQEENQLEKAAE